MELSMLQFLSLMLLSICTVRGQMSTDNRLCGGYQRSINGFLDFKFDENTAPPGTAMGKKFCMWTISPTLPAERFRYNMTIRNMNLDCSKDSLAINYFDESAADVMLHETWDDPSQTANPLCLESHEVWERRHVNGTVMVVILYVEEVVYGKGFYLEWEQGFNSIRPGRPRNTFHSFGKPSVAPNPYFAAQFRGNEISTFGFVKANYTDGFVMNLNFWEVRVCEGQNEWMQCFSENTFTVFQVEDSGILTQMARYTTNATNTPVLTSRNGFFIIVKIEYAFGAGGGFTLYYDTVPG